MHPSAFRFAVVAAALVAFAGCKKKEKEASADAQTTEVAKQAEAALPPTEQVEPTPAEVAADKVALIEPTDPAKGAEFEAWFKKYKLDLTDPGMLDADPDGDGASNRDEFLADTNPTDANSRPGIHKAIRLKEFSEVRLPLVVESVQGETARIRRTDGEGKVETVKAGDSIRGLPLKVSKVREFHDTDKEGHPIDRSVVQLEDSGSKERLTLVKDMPARTAASFAMLTSTDGATTIKVKQGDTFKWPGDDTASYKVIDLREDQVVLQQVENKKMWTVTRTAVEPK